MPPRPQTAATNSSRTSSFPTQLLDKDLPPTPQSPSTENVRAPPVPTREIRQSTMRAASQAFPMGFSLSTPASLSKSSASIETPLPSPTSTPALVRAALGLGLPYVMPSASASSSSSEVNTIAFLTASPPAEHRRMSTSPGKVRRVRSSHTLSGQGSSTPPVAPEPVARRRTRRTSAGPAAGPRALGKQSPDPKGKSKAQEISVHEPPPEPPAPLANRLVRRASFWKTKRPSSSHAPETPSLTEGSTTSRLSASSSFGRPSLPYIPPVSPFRVADGDVSRSSSPSQHGHEPSPTPVPPPPGLVRRHSDRKASRQSPPSISPITPTSTPPIPASLPRSGQSRYARPSTADSIVSRERARSLFLDSPRLSASTPPPSTPPLPAPSGSPKVVHPRQRAQTNPHILQRLSLNLFSFGSSSALPLPDRSVSNPITHSPPSSPRPSNSRPSIEIPRPRTDGDTPEAYIQRLTKAVTKADIAIVLATNGDQFHAQCLRIYIGRFDFANDPLDVALRKLLMEVGLPRETQQIDRVMEAFAARYRQCNPDLFISDDHPYILAFSLIMLHTDAFNKSNKRKMTKPDYMKNTRLPGVSPEVLDCFYDNTVFAPFIFIEDPLDAANGYHVSETNLAQLPSGLPVQASSSSSGTLGLLGRSNKIDLYHVIANNLLDSLRVDVEAYVPLKSPYRYEGSLGSWDHEELRRNFVEPGGGEATKFGRLECKEARVVGGITSMSRKWRDCTVILTSTRLLLFRDIVRATNFLEQAKSSSRSNQPLTTAMPFKPDERLSMKDAIAVLDSSYKKYPYTFRFVIHDSRHLLFRASNEKEMNEWISMINYASAFQSNSLRMRRTGVASRDVELMGVAAAASHMRDTMAASLPSSAPLHVFTRPESDEFGGRLTDSPPSSLGDSRNAKSEAATPPTDIDVETGSADLDEAQQLQATFDQVKVDLAAGRTPLFSEPPITPRKKARTLGFDESFTLSPARISEDGDISSPRVRVILSKLKELDQKYTTTQTHLDSELRLVRNIRVLTPFQRTTRDRLVVAVQNASHRIKQLRLEVARLACHRDVLRSDMQAEERAWTQTRRIAMKAATESLHTRRETMLPSFNVEGPDRSSSSPHGSSNAPSPHPPDSSGGSYHSAFDFDWSMSTMADDSTQFGVTEHIVASPLMTPVTEDGPHGNGGSFPFNHDNGSTPPSHTHSHHYAESTRGDSVDLPHARSSHEKYITAPEMPEEEAEQWDKTRAAKRVSLVKTPSNFRLNGLDSSSGSSVQRIRTRNGT